MVVREGRRLREADDAQHRCDGAPGWCEDCACDEDQHMAEGRSREAGSERFNQVHISSDPGWTGMA